jgi:hypothetical protein
MIRYSLACAAGHAFEGWFRSGADFDAQAAGGHVTCPACGSPSVGRALMAPNVQTSRRKPEPAPAQPMEAAAFTPPDPRLAAMMAAMRDLKARVIETTDDVGDGFADEARRIHYGETDARGIRGRASADEARALVDEGIEIMPLPVLPDERN